MANAISLAYPGTLFRASTVVEVQVVSTASCVLAAQFKAGDHDLVILDRGLEPRQWPATEIWRQPMRWITSDEHGQHLRDPLPLAVSPADCPWRPPWLSECLSRGIATRALEQAAGSSGSRIRKHHAGQFAAVSAGLAVAASMAVWSLPPGLRAVRDDEGLPALPDASYLMLKARDPRQPMTDMLAARISEVFGAVLPSLLKFARF